MIILLRFFAADENSHLLYRGRSWAFERDRPKIWGGLSFSAGKLMVRFFTCVLAHSCSLFFSFSCSTFILSFSLLFFSLSLFTFWEEGFATELYSVLGTVLSVLCELICLLPSVLPGDRYSNSWRNWGTERVNHLFKVTWFVCFRESGGRQPRGQQFHLQADIIACALRVNI